MKNIGFALLSILVLGTNALADDAAPPTGDDLNTKAVQARVNLPANIRLELYSGMSDYQTADNKPVPCQVVIGLEDKTSKIRYFSAFSNTNLSSGFVMGLGVHVFSYLDKKTGGDGSDLTDMKKEQADALSTPDLIEADLPQSSSDEAQARQQAKDDSDGVGTSSITYSNSRFPHKSTKVTMAGKLKGVLTLEGQSVEARLDRHDSVSSVDYTQQEFMQGQHEVSCSALKLVKTYDASAAQEKAAPIEAADLSAQSVNPAVTTTIDKSVAPVVQPAADSGQDDSKSGFSAHPGA